MRIAAMVLGLIGGLVSALGVYWGWPGVGGEYLAWGILSSIFGIAGGILALRRPKVSGVLMLLGGMGGWSALLAVLVFEGLYCQVHGAPRLCDAHFAFYRAFIFAGSPLFIGAALSHAASKEYHRGSIAAMVLGLIGGLIGILGVWHSPWIPGEYLVWGILSSFIGIAGGTLALKKPKVSGILMLLSAMGGWSAVIAALIFEGFWYLGTHLPIFTFRYIIAGPLLFIGAALSLLACKEYLRGSKSAMILGAYRWACVHFGR